MQGFRTKHDGLVNAGDIAKTRVENPKDVLKRDQEVFVKVISMAGGRIRLSMRDVDQKTGKDMVPMSSTGTASLALSTLDVLFEALDDFLKRDIYICVLWFKC